MKRATAFSLTLLAGIVVGWAFGPSPANKVYVSRFAGVMGTSLEVRVEASSEAAGREAQRVALDEIARSLKILSGGDAASAPSQRPRAGVVAARVSPELIEVLVTFEEWRSRASRPPSASSRPLDRAWMLNSFTKSYVVDRAARRALAVPGVSGVLLNAGGDVVVRGSWTQSVGIGDPVANSDSAPPLTTLSVHDAVVATSGSTRRAYDLGGPRYSYVFDRGTSRPANYVLSATVVSPNAVEAGTLAAAFCRLTLEESAALARTRPGVHFALSFEGGQRIESPGWHALERHQERTSPYPFQAPSNRRTTTSSAM